LPAACMCSRVPFARASAGEASRYASASINTPIIARCQNSLEYQGSGSCLIGSSSHLGIFGPVSGCCVARTVPRMARWLTDGPRQARRALWRRGCVRPAQALSSSLRAWVRVWRTLSWPAQGSCRDSSSSRSPTLAMVHWAAPVRSSSSSQLTGIETPMPGRARAEKAAAVVAPTPLRR
jgi:hypothetical protein